MSSLPDYYQEFSFQLVSIEADKQNILANWPLRSYRIAGNSGKVFNLANWQFYRKSPNLKSAIFYSDDMYTYWDLSCHQIKNSPNRSGD